MTSSIGHGPKNLLKYTLNLALIRIIGRNVSSKKKVPCRSRLLLGRDHEDEARAIAVHVTCYAVGECHVDGTFLRVVSFSLIVATLLATLIESQTHSYCMALKRICVQYYLSFPSVSIFPTLL